ncbi:MAG: DUF885 domain-containing protein [Candidatus Eremiobacteraeota bacterium]|nr:DUF885 domain-containing protein [Candidatus Eremiobacteraeota bacterium]
MQENIKASEKIKSISEEYLKSMLEDFPAMATMMGIYDRDGELGILDSDKVEKIIKENKKFQSDLDRIDPSELSVPDRVDYKLLKSEFRKGIREMEHEKRYSIEPSLYPEMCFNSVYGILFRHRDRLKEKAGDIISRMKQIPRYLKEGRKLLKNPPRIYVESAIESASSGKVLFKESLGELFNTELSEHLDEYEKARDEVLESLEEYKKFLKDELIHRAVPDFAIGKEAFNDRLKYDHFLDEDVDEIEALGKEIYEKVDLELKDLAKKIDPDLPWVDIVRKYKKIHPDTDELIAAYTQETQKARRFIEENDLVSFPPGEKVEVIFTPPFQQHLIPWAAFFPCAYFDKESMGHFVVTPPNPDFPPEKQLAQLQEHNRYKMVLNSVHEAYPGHHLQFSFARENPRLARAISMSTLFAEGWALYTEELMKETGYLKEPVQILFQLKDKVWRAARILIDVGLHAKGMTVDEAVEILRDTIGYSEFAALTEVKRYTRTPTQPMSYLVGLSKIIKIRDKFRAKHPDLPLKEFHDRILKIGTIPPRLVEEELGLI